LDPTEGIDFPEVGAPPTPALEASRANAVDSVLGGGVATVVGGGLLVASIYQLFGPASLFLGLGGVVLGGGGLIRISMAAKHLLRFGSRESVVTLGAVGALGAVAAVWPIMATVRLFGVWSAPMWFRQTYPVVLLGLIILVLYMVLRILARWALPRDGGEFLLAHGDRHVWLMREGLGDSASVGRPGPTGPGGFGRVRADSRLPPPL
jgi:hypothetical protein